MTHTDGGPAFPAQPTALLPCPFCGNSDLIVSNVLCDENGKPTGPFSVECPTVHVGGADDWSCGTMRFGNTRAEAIAAWNTRAPFWHRMDDPANPPPKDGAQFLASWQLPTGSSYGVVYWEDDVWFEAYSPVLQPTHWQPLTAPQEGAE